MSEQAKDFIKPDGIRLAGVYEILSRDQPPRTVICESLEWDATGFTKISFYEPGTNLINECTIHEVAKMIESGVLQIKSVKHGRKVW